MFKNESLLVNGLADSIVTGGSTLPTFKNSSNMHLLKEVNLGYGIADLVITQFNEINHTRNVFLNSAQIKILSIIENSRSITLNEIKDKTKASNQLINRSLKILEGEKLIIRKDDKIILKNKYMNSLKNSIAIEAKLTNWRRALKQAYRYKWFCDSSYVCLPSVNIQSALSNIDSFKQMNVGLFSLDSNNQINIFFSPKPAKPICKEMNILLNECLLSQLYISL